MFPRFFRNGCVLALTLCILSVEGAISPAMAQPAKSVQEHFNAAQGYMQAGQWDYASFEWRSVLEREPGNVQAILGLAKALQKTGLNRDSLAFLEQSRAKAKNVAVDLTLAEDYKKFGEYQKSKDVFLEVLAKDPFEPRAFKGLLSLLPVLPEQDRAVGQKALAQRADEARNKALVAMKAGQYQDAVRYYEINNAFYHKIGTLNDLSLAKLLSGQKEGAVQEFGKLNKMKNNNWQLHANYALSLLSVGKFFDAQKQMEKAIGFCNNPKVKPLLYNNLGYIYEAGNKRTKARFAYERAVELDPAFTKAQMNLGFIYQREREFQRALDLYKNLLSREPNNAEAMNQMGFTYELLHKPKPALSAYKRALEIDPNLKDAYFNIGTLYKKMNKLDDSAQAFKKMTDLEFMEIESGQKNNPAKASKTSDLFKYVDVFFFDDIHKVPAPAATTTPEAKKS